MLYININNKQLHTAYQALNERDSMVVPLRLPHFSQADLGRVLNLSFAGATAEVVNLFFGTAIDGRSIDICLKENQFIPEPLDRKTLVVKLHKDDEHGFEALINRIGKLISNVPLQQYCWLHVAIRIGLLFGLAADLRRCGIRSVDIAVYSNDLKDLLPIAYAKKMGVPVNKIICGCLREDDLWKLLHAGSLSALNDPLVRELVYGYTFNKDVIVDDELLTRINEEIITFVISLKRRTELASNVLSTYGRIIDSNASVAYGALQDYRSSSGENNITIIYSEE